MPLRVNLPGTYLCRSFEKRVSRKCWMKNSHSETVSMKTYLLLALAVLYLRQLNRRLRRIKFKDFREERQILSSNYVINDFKFYPAPNIPRPQKGQLFEIRCSQQYHQNYGCLIGFPGSAYKYAYAGYPKHNIENADGTKLVIQSMKYPGWTLECKLPYNKIKDLPNSIVG